MDEKTFITKVAEIVEEDECSVSINSNLDDFDSWDSLARITFLVFVSDTLKKRIDGSLVKEAKTVRDLYNIAVN